MEKGCSLFEENKKGYLDLPCYFFSRSFFFEENDPISGQPYSPDVDERKGSELGSLRGRGPLLPCLFHCVSFPIESGGGKGFGVLPYMFGKSIV